MKNSFEKTFTNASINERRSLVAQIGFSKQKIKFLDDIYNNSLERFKDSLYFYTVKALLLGIPDDDIKEVFQGFKQYNEYSLDKLQGLIMHSNNINTSYKITTKFGSHNFRKKQCDILNIFNDSQRAAISLVGTSKTYAGHKLKRSDVAFIVNPLYNADQILALRDIYADCIDNKEDIEKYRILFNPKYSFYKMEYVYNTMKELSLSSKDLYENGFNLLSENCCEAQIKATLNTIAKKSGLEQKQILSLYKQYVYSDNNDFYQVMNGVNNGLSPRQISFYNDPSRFNYLQMKSIMTALESGCTEEQIELLCRIKNSYDMDLFISAFLNNVPFELLDNIPKDYGSSKLLRRMINDINDKKLSLPVLMEMQKYNWALNSVIPKYDDFLKQSQAASIYEAFNLSTDELYTLTCENNNAINDNINDLEL